MFRGCKIFVKDVVLKANLIPLKMWDFDVILGTDSYPLTECQWIIFTKKVVFQKLGFLKLEFEGERKGFTHVRDLGFGSKEITAQKL